MNAVSKGLLFLLEHAGELRIIILIEEKESYIDPSTDTHLNPLNVSRD